MSKRTLGWVVFGVCAAAAVFVVAGGHTGTVVGDPLRLWGRWLSGEKVDDARLWGWPMLAWGRTGKLLQFTAGLTVVLDLAGPDRLREFGTRLRRQSWRKLADRLEEPVLVGAALFMVVYTGSILVVPLLRLPQAASRAVFGVLLGPVGFTGLMLCLLSLGFLFLTRWKRNRDEDERVPSLVGYVPVLLVAGVPVLLWVGVTRGLLIPLTNGLARAFDRTHPGYPLRWAAFALFVIGFGLDLLAS